MSTMTQGIDARAYLAGWLEGLVSMYSADIAAIPDDKWTATFGGCTRSASSITADAIGMLKWATDALRGHVAEGMDEGMSAFMSACSTKEGAANALRTTAEEFNQALTSASDETLNSMVTPPWKMDTPLFMMAQIAVSHVWYHDGQLNYIQSLLGDDKIHWMGE